MTGDFFIFIGVYSEIFVRMEIQKLIGDLIFFFFFFFLLQRRHGRAALLPALEQLPVEHDVRLSSAAADGGLRGRHPGLQRGFVKGAQGRPVEIVERSDHRAKSKT